LPAALLFDLDGTLVDTDRFHLSAFQRVFAPFGIALDRARYAADIMGAANETIGRTFLPHLSEMERTRVIEAKEAAYRAHVGALTPMAGLIELLEFCDKRALKRAVVTNAPRANAELVIGALKLKDRLPILVCSPELERGKPDPLPYLTALKLTGARAKNSVAFEDSLSGVRAAAAAGICVVGLTTGLDEERLIAAGARFAVANFHDERVYEIVERRIAVA
jgi:HAD superfamily hydrolase (TIGR01509 family)